MSHNIYSGESIKNKDSNCDTKEPENNSYMAILTKEENNFVKKLVLITPKITSLFNNLYMLKDDEEVYQIQLYENNQEKTRELLKEFKKYIKNKKEHHQKIY